MNTSATDDDPTNDPQVPGHEEGTKAPFPPTWEGDPHAGHHRSCAVRVKAKCTCGMAEVIAAKEALQIGRVAEMRIAGDYLHKLLALPEDVHIVGALWENVYDADLGNVVLRLEAFSDNEFPGRHVTAEMTRKWNVATGEMDTVFVDWQVVD